MTVRNHIFERTLAIYECQEYVVKERCTQTPNINIKFV